MEFYSDHLLATPELEHVGANCHWPQSEEKPKEQLNKKSA